MSHFAEIINGIVVRVIVAEQDFINTLDGNWIQTSYNTYMGIHTLGGIPLRKNYAVIGSIYDKTRDAFFSSKPYPSWVLNEDTCNWESPILLPNNLTALEKKYYKWNENTLSWDYND